MENQEKFIEAIKNGYTFKGKSIKLGAGMFDGKVISEAEVFIPLSTMNRHGLISGATGGGKTKSFQMIAEKLSDEGVPVLLMDIKGDMSGIAAEGAANDKIDNRYRLLNMEFKPESFPVELLTLSNEQGVRLRATVSEFGPVLMTKILGLNDTQGGVVAMIFKYCDDKTLPLLDLKDFIKVLQFAGNEGKDEFKENYGNISPATTGTIMRKVIELQQQGADMFFGEKSFEVEDLMRTTRDGRGIISILRVTDLQDRPKLFSTFMLQMLAELYSVAPELGDIEKPKLVFFIDEAHLIFQEATKALLNQIETVVKLIRSKGIGIYFCTQNPMDVPAGILGQLGLKIQHSLRAFTAKDRATIKQTAENYPLSDFYKTEDLITQLGIGEALVTILNEKGVPTPLVHTMMCTPRSRMDVLNDSEISKIVDNSALITKYNRTIDERSAYEMLTEKMQEAAQLTAQEKQVKQVKEEKPKKEAPSALEQLGTSVMKSMMRQGSYRIARTILGTFGLGGRSKGLRGLF